MDLEKLPWNMEMNELEKNLGEGPDERRNSSRKKDKRWESGLRKD